MITPIRHFCAFLGLIVDSGVCYYQLSVIMYCIIAKNDKIEQFCRSKSFSSRLLPDDCVWMDSTKLKNSIICFPQQRNIHNNIFGGFLMRKGYELAWANACVYRYVMLIDVIRIFNFSSLDGRVVRASASVAVDPGLIPSRAKPMTS